MSHASATVHQRVTSRYITLHYTHACVSQGPDLQNMLRFIIKLSLKFIVRLTYDSHLQRAKNSPKNVKRSYDIPGELYLRKATLSL